MIWQTLKRSGLFWFLLSFSLVVVPSFAFAEDIPPLGLGLRLSFSNDTSSTRVYSTAAAACSAGGFGYSGSYTLGSPYTYVPMAESSYLGTGLGAQVGVCSVSGKYLYIRSYCPSGSTIVSSGGVNACRFATTCAPPLIRDLNTGACVPPPCQAGTAGEGTFDIAYRSNTNTADGSSLIGPTRIPTTACEGNCQLSVGAYSGGCWLKTESGPPYVVACAFTTTTTGQSCTAADTSGSGPLPPIPCPEGTAEGSVNEVSGCYPVTTTEKETTKTDNPDSTTTEQTTETTCTGDQCSTKTTTRTCDQAGNCTESTTETPASGPTDEPTAEEKEIEEKLCETDPECAAGKFTKGEKGTFDLGAATSEKVAAEQAVRNKFAEIRAQAAGLWGGVSGSGGSIPSLGSFTVLGHTTTWTLKPEWMDWIPAVVMLMAAILAGFILFRD